MMAEEMPKDLIFDSRSEEIPKDIVYGTQEKPKAPSLMERGREFIGAGTTGAVMGAIAPELLTY
jgi:hypothetical protein